MRPLLVCILLVLVSAASAQTPADRNRARAQNRLGWEEMRAEGWAKAARSFQNAIAIDPTFEVPYYGLGRAQMALKNFAAAIAAYERCRGLYQAQASRQFTNAQEAQRFRRDRIIEIDDQIRQVQAGPMTIARSELLRQLQNVRRDIEENLQRGNDVTIESAVPAWVSLALGSAYFRVGRIVDAEREYKATLSADSRSGEAHSNLAVVYFETQRIKLALDAIESARKTGFRVNPDLEKAIRAAAK